MAVKSRRQQQQQQQQHRETRHDKSRRSGPEIEEKKSGVFDRGKSRLVSGQISSRGGSLLNIGIPLLLGLGDPASFYVAIVFALNGLMLSFFFIIGAYLSGSSLGGIMTVLCFFFNHGESTRVMWTPPLRESFSYPFLILQMLVLTHILRTPKAGKCAFVALSVSMVFFMLPWQFAQFVLLTQIAQSIILLISTIILKMLLSILLRTSDDAHISNLIKSKFTSYKDFDTMMYTCAAEFDFMEKETPLRYTRTLLLPTTLFVIIAVTVKIIKDVWIFSRKTENHMLNGDKYSLETTAQFSNGEMVYHFFQLIAFAVLAILIMRLKLFLTPHMCIMASLLCSRQLFGWIKPKALHHLLVVGVISAMAVQGVANLRGQWDIIGEFSNVPQEELLEWIKARTKAVASVTKQLIDPSWSPQADSPVAEPTASRAAKVAEAKASAEDAVTGEDIVWV
ncbi:D19L1 mannosyltransferase, partial [Polypterus senegalus]